MPTDFSLIAQPMFSAATVDRAAHLRGDAAVLEKEWPTALVMRVDAKGRFRTEVVDIPAHAGRPGTGHAATGDSSPGRYMQLTFDPAFDIAERPPHLAVFLGIAPSGRHIWALQTDTLGTAGVSDLRSCGEFLLPHDAALAAEAVALLAWHRANNAGKRPETHLARTQSGWAGRDPVLQVEEFPRTDPAVICLVHDGHRKMLLARNASWTSNFYSVLAGFVEAGESLENCVIREIFEEVGLDVTNPRYLGSQPWPFPRSLMLGFHARADPSQRIDHNDGEISESRWLDVREVERLLAGEDTHMALPGKVSISRIMIESWVAAVNDELDHGAGVSAS